MESSLERWIKTNDIIPVSFIQLLEPSLDFMDSRLRLIRVHARFKGDVFMFVSASRD